MLQYWPGEGHDTRDRDYDALLGDLIESLERHQGMTQDIKSFVYQGHSVATLFDTIFSCAHAMENQGMSVSTVRDTMGTRGCVDWRYVTKTLRDPVGDDKHFEERVGGGEPLLHDALEERLSNEVLLVALERNSAGLEHLLHLFLPVRWQVHRGGSAPYANAMAPTAVLSKPICVFAVLDGEPRLDPLDRHRGGRATHPPRPHGQPSKDRFSSPGIPVPAAGLL